METGLRKPAAVTLVAALLLSVPAATSWGNDPIDEPSSVYDEPKFMWQDAPDAETLPIQGDRIYFNGQLSNAFALRNVNLPGGRAEPALVKADALLGYWRDCNNDGYIGHRVLGMKDYTVTEAAATPFPVDERVCPPGSQYHIAAGWPGFWFVLGPVIHEFIDLGPARNYYRSYVTWQVDDPDARVWGDIGLPHEPYQQTAFFRDPVAEPIPFLFFPDGTFDSYNGHLRYADLVTFGGASDAYEAVTQSDYYGTPVGEDASPLTTVRYQGITAGNTENGWEGRPLVRTWGCESPEAEPHFEPAVDPDGAVLDSANNTFAGARTTVVVPNPAGGTLFSGALNLGPGCDGSAGQQTFGDGLLVPHMEDPTVPTTDRKVATDMFFQYRPPHDQPSDMATAMWGAVPRLDRTFSATWYAHQVFFHDGPIDRDADYFTFYAKVGTAATDTIAVPAAGPGSFPGAREVNGQTTAPAYTYGEEACAGGTDLGWDCTGFPTPGAAWDRYFNEQWGVRLGETYQLRDVDCVDLTVAAPAESDAAKAVANEVWGTAVTSVFDPVPSQVGDEAFSETCR